MKSDHGDQVTVSCLPVLLWGWEQQGLLGDREQGEGAA